MASLHQGSAVVASVVVTYNRQALLRECLRANLGQSRPPDRLVVVDNASSDGTLEMLEGEGWLAEPRLYLHRLESNRGGAGGFHAGLAMALALGADWFWLMDDDAIPEPDALEQLLLRAVDNDRWPVLASRVVTRSGATDVAHRLRVHHAPFRTSHVPASAYREDVLAADAASFVGPLLHRRHLLTCGLPRAEYFLYYDDVEFTHRIRRAGFELFIVPQSRIRHLDEGRSLREAMGESNWGWRMYYRVRNRVHWYREIEPRIWSLGPWLVAVLVIQFALVLLRQPSKRQRARLLTRALSDGWRGTLGKTIDPALYREGT